MKNSISILEPDALRTFRVARGIITYDLARLIRVAPLNLTEKAISHAISTYWWKDKGQANPSRDQLISGASSSKTTLDRAMRALKTETQGRPPMWVVVAGRGGNRAKKDREGSGTFVASRYFITEAFVLDAMARLEAETAANALKRGNDPETAVDGTVRSILKELDFFTIDENGREVKGSSSRALETVETPIETPEAPMPVDVAVDVAEAPLEAPKAPMTAPVAKEPVPTPAPRVEAPTAPAAPVGTPREWKVSPVVVKTILGFTGGVVTLEAIEKYGDVAAINAAANRARVAALSGVLGVSAPVEALSARVTAASSNGAFPPDFARGAWLVQQLEEITRDFREKKSFDEVFAA